jgi:hypothetical protein
MRREIWLDRNSNGTAEMGEARPEVLTRAALPL